MRNPGKSRAPLLFLDGGIRGVGIPAMVIIDEFFDVTSELSGTKRQPPRPWLRAKKGRRAE